MVDARRVDPVIDADSDGDGIGDVGILSSDDENWDEYVKGPDELVMLPPRVNVLDQMEVLLLGSLGANVPVRDDDSRPARDKAKEAAQKAARKALGRQEKERRSKSRKLN